jgi:putative nucleotidyltransferase with HDIG domain
MASTVHTALENLKPGMVLAETVYHPGGHKPLLATGTVVTANVISTLYRAGLGSVLTFDFESTDTPPESPPPSVPTPASTPPVAIASPPAPTDATRGPRENRGISRTGPLGNLFPSRPVSAPRISSPGHQAPNEVQRAQNEKIEKIARDVVNHNVRSIREIARTYKESATLDFDKADNCVQQTLQEIVLNREILSSLVDLRVRDEYTYAHSANVMSLALLMGVTLGYPVEKLRLLGIGALLHDIGKNLIPDFILNKAGKLTEAEFSVMRTHPEKGLRLIQNHRWATPEIKGIVLHHHERWDGKGYPYGLKGEDIPEMARVVAVCDVWDALISNRVYKRGMPPNHAYKIILDGMDSHFERRMVWSFQNFIVPYPKNALVLLNSGEVAKVVQVNREDSVRPVIELNGSWVDLTRHGRLQVVDLYRTEGQI